MSTGWRNDHCHELSVAGPSTSCYRGGDGNGRRMRHAPRARPPRCRTCDGDWAEATRHPTPQAEGGFASRLRGLLDTRGRALGPGRGDLLPWGVYRGGAGYGAPQGHRGLHNRVCAGSQCRQPCRGLFLFERQWRGPEWTKPAERPRKHCWVPAFPAFIFSGPLTSIR
jgi:hypothetical protein